jgi:hypothetical protein
MELEVPERAKLSKSPSRVALEEQAEYNVKNHARSHASDLKVESLSDKISFDSLKEADKPDPLAILDLLEHLAPFLPTFLIDRVTSDPKACLLPSKDTIGNNYLHHITEYALVFQLLTPSSKDASVLIISIGGLNELTALFSKKGSAGVGELVSQLNYFFGLSLSIINKFDGDVVHFSG